MKIIAAIFLLTTITTAQQSEYLVPGFSYGDKAFPQQGNEIIQPESGESLAEMNVMPLLSQGEVVLRRRFGPSEYRLYKGKFTPEAFGEKNNLFIFQPPEGLSVVDAVKMKWYKEETNNPNLDEADVYFDNTKIYVRFLSRLFYMQAKWKIITAKNIKPVTVNAVSGPGFGSNDKIAPVNTLALENQVTSAGSEPDSVNYSYTNREENTGNTGKGFLKLDVYPDSAEILVDGDSYGTGSRKISLAPGKHRLHVQTSEGKSLTREIEIFKGETTSKKIKLKYKARFCFSTDYALVSTVNASFVALCLNPGLSLYNKHYFGIDLNLGGGVGLDYSYELHYKNILTFYPGVTAGYWDYYNYRGDYYNFAGLRAPFEIGYKHVFFKIAPGITFGSKLEYTEYSDYRKPRKFATFFILNTGLSVRI